MATWTAVVQGAAAAQDRPSSGLRPLHGDGILEFIIMDRFPVSKYSSARSFERSAGHTRSVNYIKPLRGGWRL